MIKFFDKLEDKIRGSLSRTPIAYAIIGGTTIVLFWRGVWHLADQLEQTGGFWGGVFSSAGSIVISVIILLATGLFVSFFIGDRIILSGLKHEKKIEEKTETEIREEETILINTAFRLERMEKDLSAIKKDLEERKMKQ